MSKKQDVEMHTGDTVRVRNSSRICVLPIKTQDNKYHCFCTINEVFLYNVERHRFEYVKSEFYTNEEYTFLKLQDNHLLEKKDVLTKYNNI